MKSIALLAATFISVAAEAGTVDVTVFGTDITRQIVIANGVRATSSAGFVLYQHGAWEPLSSAPVAAATPVALISSLAPIGVSACDSQFVPLRRGLSTTTMVYRRAYLPLIRQAECRHALPVGLLDALVLQESHYKPFAVSPVGASGLTQLMPKTASGLGVTNRFDPSTNIDGGARYLRSMLDHYRSVPLALAAYNAGRHNVDRSGGIPANRETPDYVRKVLGYFNQEVDGALAPAPPEVSHVISLVFSAPQSN